MQIFVKIHGGKTIALDVEASDSLSMWQFASLHSSPSLEATARAVRHRVALVARALRAGRSGSPHVTSAVGGSW